VRRHEDSPTNLTRRETPLIELMPTRSLCARLLAKPSQIDSLIERQPCTLASQTTAERVTSEGHCRPDPVFGEPARMRTGVALELVLLARSKPESGRAHLASSAFDDPSLTSPMLARFPCKCGGPGVTPALEREDVRLRADRDSYRTASCGEQAACTNES